MEVVEEPVGEGCCQFMGGLDSEKHISLKPKDFFANERNFIHWMHMCRSQNVRLPFSVGQFADPCPTGPPQWARLLR
eukprot:880137-Rhodomonas_salina.1